MEPTFAYQPPTDEYYVGFERGYRLGYYLAVEESYPELDPAWHSARRAEAERGEDKLVTLEEALGQTKAQTQEAFDGRD